MSYSRYKLPENPGIHHLDAQTELQFVFTPVTQGFSGESSDPLSVRLLYITTAKYEHDWQSRPHSHAFSELFYITDGRGRFVVRGKSFYVEKDSFIIIPPQVEHTEFSVGNQPLEYIVLGIDGLNFTRIDTEAANSPAIQIANTFSSIPLYMESLLDEARNNNLGHNAICQNLLNIILICILRNSEIRISITASQNVSSECAAVKSYIDAHFKESLTLDDLAEEAHQNKYYIAHAFKEAYGISPIKYLMSRRVEESKYMLADTNYSILEIASMTGFSSASHFSQAFRRLTELSPNEYRKAAQAEK